MKILILGGTRFVGLNIAKAALNAGHEITVFNRGTTNVELLPGVEKLVGDRNDPDGYEALKGRTWDAVIDVSAVHPFWIREALAVLVDATDHFTYMSGVRVYEDLSNPFDEESPLIQIPEPIDREITPQNGAGLMAMSDQEVQRIWDKKAFIVRPTYIVGPDDFSDRFTYWLMRIAKGGPMLAPGSPQGNLSIIDVRDLSEWMIRMIENNEGNVYNAFGPDYDLTYADVFELAKKITGGDPEFIWVSSEFATEHELFGMPMPVWNPEPEFTAWMTAKSPKAVRAGLTYRPLEETLRDLYEWRTSGVEDQIKAKPGFEPEREAELIKMWRASQR